MSGRGDVAARPARRGAARAAARRLAAFGAAVAAGAAACVEITAGPGGIASIRLLDVPPSIVIGDVLRDSLGGVLRLQAIAYDANGAPLAEAPFRFIYVPLSTDTTRRDDAALVVDSLTGGVRAPGPPFVAPRGRVGVRIGDRLQVLDTVEIVPRPRRLLRGEQGGDSARRLVFACQDAAGAAPFNSRLDSAQARNARVDTGSVIGNTTTLATVLRGDSASDTTRAVRSYLVRYEIVRVTPLPSGGIPTVRTERGTRAAIEMIDGSTDTPLRFDTTDASGVAAPRLRLFAPGLTRAAFPDPAIDVTVRAYAVRSRTDTVPSPVQFVVRLLRQTNSTATGAAIACP